VSITDRDRQHAASIPDLVWVPQRGASEDSVAGVFAAAVVLEEAVAGSTAEEAVAALTVGNW
jgi:hypothetical protein